MTLELDQFPLEPDPPAVQTSLAEVIGSSSHGVDAAYVHVPFCFHKCHYCDFYSIVDSSDRQEVFVQRLEQELSTATTHIEGSLESVFIGGGTTTLLRPDLLRRVLQSIDRHLPLAEDCEWTVEANPETVSSEVAEVLVAGGVNRVSVGCQSFTPRLLEALERHHDPDNVALALERFRAVGLDRISLDLIMGIPGSRFEDWAFDLRTARSLGPQHLSCYGLQYEPNTPLGARLLRGHVEQVDDALEADMYEHTCSALSADGFAQYEISNWARPGQACRHNLIYWQGGNWLAFGPSASGHLDGTRWRNVSRLASWLEPRGSTPVEDFERLDNSTRRGEQLMLQLRLNRGMPVAELEALLALESTDTRRRALDQGRLDGLLERDQGHLRLTDRGRLLADSLLCQLV